MTKNVEQMQQVSALRDEWLRDMGTLSDPQKIVADHMAVIGAMIKVHNNIADADNDNLRLLREGRWYTPQALPAGYVYGESRQCYSNSARLAVRNPHLTYCEGVALGILPVHHAWCIDRAGKVIDVTWRTGEQSGHDPATMAYLGIPFDEAEVSRVLAGHGTCLFDWRRLSLDGRR